MEIYHYVWCCSWMLYSCTVYIELFMEIMWCCSWMRRQLMGKLCQVCFFHISQSAPSHFCFIIYISHFCIPYHSMPYIVRSGNLTKYEFIKLYLHCKMKQRIKYTVHLNINKCRNINLADISFISVVTPQQKRGTEQFWWKKTWVPRVYFPIGSSAKLDWLLHPFSAVNKIAGMEVKSRTKRIKKVNYLLRLGEMQWGTILIATMHQLSPESFLVSIKKFH